MFFKNEEASGVNMTSIDKMKDLFEKIARLRMPYINNSHILEYGSFLGRWKVGNIKDPTVLKEQVEYVEERIDNYLKEDDAKFQQELEKFPKAIRDHIKMHIPYNTYLQWESGLTFEEWISENDNRKSQATISEEDIEKIIQIKKNEGLECFENGKSKLKEYLKNLKEEAEFYLSSQNKTPC